MNKFLKLLLLTIGITAFALCAIAVYLQMKGIPKYPVEPINLVVDTTKERIANGKRLANTLCVNCHASNSGSLTGKHILDIPTQFGKIYSKNITHDSIVGIGKWSDGELLYFLRTGVRPDGQYVPPYMPKFPLMADEDLKDIIAWLRSDSFGLQPSKEEAPDTDPSLLLLALSNFVWKPMPLPQEEIKRPDTTNDVATGAYYANAVVGCYHCHSKDFKTVDYLIPENSEGFYGGGNAMLNFEGETVVSSNLTFDKSGLAEYTEMDFHNALKRGFKKNGKLIKYPMVPYPTLSDLEVRSIYAYLKTLPLLNKESE